MSSQKPVKKAYQQQPQVVKNWLDKEYPRIARKAAQEKAKILWGDEMGVRSDDQIGRTYGRVGQTPLVKVSGQRFSCQMISTVSNCGKRAANKDKLKKNLVGYLRGRQKRPALVRRYFEAKHIRYAA
jgi:hypothetical protein